MEKIYNIVDNNLEIAVVMILGVFVVVFIMFFLWDLRERQLINKVDK